MNEILLSVQRRAPGRSVARMMRRQGVVPGIYYYHGEEPIAIAVAELSLRPLIETSESHLVRIKLEDGTEKTCILKDMDFHPVTDRPVHFDLQGVAANETIKVEVPIALQGMAIGQRDGGVVEFVLHKVEVECLPKYLPDHINVDITDLAIGQSIHVGDIVLENVTILTAADVTVALVASPRVESSDAEGGAAEPEVITKSKSDEG